MDIDLSQSAPRVHTLEEAQTLIDALWALAQAQARTIEAQARQIEALNQRIAKLEERLATNSRNSSTPPSLDPHRPPAKKSPTGKKRGAQPGHAGKARTLLPPAQVTQEHDCRPGFCPACGGAVKITGLIARHQVIDLPPMVPCPVHCSAFRCRSCAIASRPCCARTRHAAMPRRRAPAETS